MVGTPRPYVSTVPGCMAVRMEASAPEPGLGEPQLVLSVAAGLPRIGSRVGLMGPSRLVEVELAGR